MWKLVAITISLGLVTSGSSNPTDRTEKTDVIRKSTPFFFSRHSETPRDTHFLCHKKPSGYYADPRFKCEVFHFCHSDGTRVTIPCHQDQQHRICLLKDIASKACDGSEIYLALPEDLYFKGSKDTTASALNGATEYKLSDVLPEPTSPPEDSRSTTPLDSRERTSSSKKPALSNSDVSSVYEVFNSFLKEIQGVQQLGARSERFTARPRPSTFSRGSRVPSTLEQKDALIDIAPAVLERRVDDGAYLVEVYNNDDDRLGDTDYSAYRRKSKKLFFNSDKKSPAKHPRRRKRTVAEQRSAGRPYAIIYAKVPDTTLASPGGANPQVSHDRQDGMEFTYGQGMVHGNGPMVPVTIETRRKLNKLRKKAASEQDQPGFQQTSEQQNVFYYAPDQANGVRQLGPGGRAVLDPRLRAPENAGQPRQNLQQPQPNPNRPAPYSPQAGNPLQLPNFPFQAQPFLSTQRQPPFYFDPQGGYQSYGTSFGGQFQGQPQQPETAVPQSQQRPSNQPQPPRQREPTNRPTEAQGSSGLTPDRARPERPPSQPQGFSGYPFFQNFPGFDEFTNSFSQREPSPYNLLSPIQQQPPPPPHSQPPQQFISQGRPAQERPQSPQSHTRPDTPRPGIPVHLQPSRDPSVFGQGIPHQDRSRQPPENSQPPPQRPTRPRGRPDEHVPVIVQEIPRGRPHSTRQPPNNAPDRPRQRPSQQLSPYDHRVIYQPEYSPEGVILRPTGPSSAPIREAIPHENQGDHRPVVILEDLRETGPPTPPHHVENHQTQPQREPVPERIRDERQRHPEHDRNRDERPRRPESSRNQEERPRRPDSNRSPPRQQSSHYFTPTTAPPSSRTRTRTRQPTRNEHHQPRPEEESVGGRNPEFGHRRPSPPEERPTHTRPRPSSPEGIPVDNRFFERPPQNRRPPSDDHRSQTPRPTRPRTTQGERTRHRPQPQIERPPSEYVLAEPLPETYEGHQGYYTHPPQGNDINAISTVEDTANRPRTPPTAAIRTPSHRGSIRNEHNFGNPEIVGGFIPMTEAPHPESTYRTRPSSKEYAEPLEDHRRPESNRYPDEAQTTRQPEATRRPTPKRKPPPKPTFPTFPTFPPPPRRPVTSPRPEVSEYTKESEGGSESRTNEPNAEYPSSRPQIDAIVEPDNSLNRDLVTEEYLQTAAPEVSTRRRTRKRKPRPRRPKPTAAYIEDDQTPGETLSQATTVRDVVTHSSPRAHNPRWQQQSSSRRTTPVAETEATTTPASAKSEEYGSRINLFGRQRPRKPVARNPATTQASPLLKEESVRVSNAPTVTRGRKAFAKRMRVKTTTTTETPETDSPIARSDENMDFLSYQSGDDTTRTVLFPEYESSTFFPSLESTTELPASTTESYNERVETTDEITTSVYDVFATDLPQEDDDQMDDFESTRSIRKKFQNRPRVLKFGKPKLRTTLSPLDLNAAESRVG